MSACIFRETDADRDPVVAVQLARWMFSWRTTPVSERRAVILSGACACSIARRLLTPSPYPPPDNTHLVGTACAVTGRTLVNVDMRLFRVNDDLELRTWEAVGRVLMLVGLDMRVCSPSRDSALYLVSRVPLPIVCICDSPESLGEDRLIERLCMRLPFASSSQSAGSPAACSFAPNKVTTGCIGDPRLVWQLMHWLEVWNTVAERRSILITGTCVVSFRFVSLVCSDGSRRRRVHRQIHVCGYGVRFGALQLGDVARARRAIAGRSDGARDRIRADARGDSLSRSRSRGTWEATGS